MDVDQEEMTSQEDIRKQQILIQNKEKKIKFIRILTVIAYLVSVSTVATMLSAYYIFIWNPHTGNFTQTPNAERIVMALQRASGEYAFVNAADHEYSGNRKFVSELLNSQKTNGHTKSSIRSILFQTSTIKSSTSHMQTTIGNVSGPFNITNNT